MLNILLELSKKHIKVKIAVLVCGNLHNGVVSYVFWELNFFIYFFWFFCETWRRAAPEFHLLIKSAIMITFSISQRINFFTDFSGIFSKTWSGTIFSMFFLFIMWVFNRSQSINFFLRLFWNLSKTWSNTVPELLFMFLDHNKLL